MQNLIKKVLNFKVISLMNFCRLVKLGGGKRYWQIRKLRLTVGAILIEFAFALPVFLVLLYYIHDLPKQKLLHRKLQFVAYELAAIVQNIAKQRMKEGKDIAKTDLRDAASLAYLSVFCGDTMYVRNGVAKLGYFPHAFLYYVEGGENGNALIKWETAFWGTNVRGSVGTYSSAHPGSVISVWSGEATSIYPGLSIKNGDTKIICECSLYYPLEDASKRFPNGRALKDVPIRDAFGFMFITPRATSQNGQAFFTGVCVFSPIGAMSSSAPQ